jgi:hypothetical protein
MPTNNNLVISSPFRKNSNNRKICFLIDIHHAPDDGDRIPMQVRRIPALRATRAGEITRHGRRELVLMSADYYDYLLAAARRTRHP